MRLKELKDLIKKSMVEVAPKKDSGAMTPEEEKMVADYEEEKANKYALDKEEPLEEEKKYYITLKSKDGKGGGTLHNLPNHINNTYSDALRSIERLKAVDGRKGKKYMYYVSDKDGNPVSNPSGITEEDILREADDIVAAWAEKQTLNEEMHGGYLELMEMNPKFDEGIGMLLDVWEEWKEGPMTEPEMVAEAKQDLLSYLSSVLE
jgi:hypothetical protein